MKTTSPLLRTLALIFLIGLMAGCALPVTPRPEEPLPAGQAIDAARPTPTLTATDTPAPTPTSTAVPTLTPTTTVAATAVLPDLTQLTRDQLATWLTSQWQQGESLAAVQTALTAAGRLAPADMAGQLGLPARALPVQAVDMDGDGREEWLLSLLLSDAHSSCGAPLLGQLWLIGAGGVILTLDVDETSAYWQVPLVIDDTDVTDDGLPDIITQSTGCGAHTNFALFHVLSAHDGMFRNIVSLPDAGDPLAQQLASLNRLGAVYAGRTPGIAISFGELFVIARDALGPSSVLVSGGSFGSIGAGLHRSRFEGWLWNGRHLALTSIEMSPSDQRLHRLYDGDFAFQRGDLDMAVARYREVIDDDTLQDEVAYSEPDGGYALARQWAAFRLQLLAYLLEDPIAVAEWAAWPDINYPDAPLTAAARRLAANVPEQGIVAGCAAVTELLAGYDAPLGGLADTGYGNPALAIEDLCPVR